MESIYSRKTLFTDIYNSDEYIKVLNIPNFHTIRQKTSIVPGNTLRQCIAGDFISTAALLSNRQSPANIYCLKSIHTIWLELPAHITANTT